MCGTQKGICYVRLKDSTSIRPDLEETVTPIPEQKYCVSTNCELSYGVSNAMYKDHTLQRTAGPLQSRRLHTVKDTLSEQLCRKMRTPA